MEKEIFIEIKGYEGLYEISSFGRVRTIKTGRIRKQEKTKQNRYRIGLWDMKRRKNYYIHRLVAIAFIDNFHNKPQVNHIDGNPSNNKVENLEWCTGSENMKHAFSLGLCSQQGEKNSMSKLTRNDVIEIKKLLKKGIFHKDIAKKFNVHRRTVTDINKGATWTHV